MSLTLPKSSLIDVNYIDETGAKTKVTLNTTIAEIAPNLTSPCVLDIITNTSAVDTSKFADIEYQAIAKTQPTITYKDGAYVTNPTDVEYKTIDVRPVRLTPVQIVNKFSLNDISIQSGQGWERALAMQIINFSENIKMDNEILAFNNLAYACQQVQEKIKQAHSNATTFKNGAHLEKKNLATADDVYNAISEAKSVIKRIGNANAKTAFDQNFKFATGIDLNDVVCLISDEILDLLLSKNGVFASDAGFEAFKSARVKMVLGIACIPTSNLPDGVNFLIFTTGKMGALAYHKVAQGDWFKYGEDPNWELNKRLHCARNQVLGVVYENLIIGSFTTSCTITHKDTYSNSRMSNRVSTMSETYEDELASNANSKEIQEQIQEQIKKLKQRLKDVKNEEDKQQTDNKSNPDNQEIPKSQEGEQ